MKEPFLQAAMHDFYFNDLRDAALRYSQKMQKAIVTVIDSIGTPCGSGFFVSDKFILTAPQVVNRALNRPSLFSGKPVSNAKIHLLYPHTTVDETPYATVAGWRIHGSQLRLAILKLETKKPPEILPIHLHISEKLHDHPANLVAYPFGNSHEAWVFGKLQKRNALRHFRFEAQSRFSQVPTNLFSGTPVWDDKELGVIGLFIDSEDSGPLAEELVILTSTILEGFFKFNVRYTIGNSKEHGKEIFRNRPMTRSDRRFLEDIKQRFYACIFVVIIFFIIILEKFS